MKKLLSAVLIGLSLILISQCFAVQLSATGKIIKVHNKTITIATPKADSIPAGSRVDVFFEISAEQSIEIGQWKVTDSGNGQVFAVPVDVLGPPQKGMTAKITYNKKKQVQNSRQNHHNASSIPQADIPRKNQKQPLYSSQHYVDEAKKLANDLGQNAARYSTAKNQKLQNQIVRNVQIAVAADNAEAYYLLAMLHQNGIGEIPQDSGEMIRNLTLSAKKGYVDAQYMLGNMYKSGDEVPKNKTEAIYWLQKAAKQGHRGAKIDLELMEPQIRGKEPRGQLLGVPFPE